MQSETLYINVPHRLYAGQLHQNGSRVERKTLASFRENNFCYPIVMVNAVEIQSRSLVDTSCQGNYASAALINHISATPVQ